ncbi:ESX-2 secretion system ATPase EccB2 [Mycobacterium simulans]|uniref:ESX-2 secretion system ATPase EccB2 n=1 Tax=Mycobacterium simulans TaxID=627089 RepID=A0A7Z7IJX9_9MYCO|nr:type VII secretion protein EccB [Mycobacterium simulans]SOJ53537.1 ESX-2 secretion system ATPase EccB2 [Mycobacterium simulans]
MTTWLDVSGHRFLVRRIECALLRRDIRTANDPLRRHPASLMVGCLLTAIAVAGCAFVALLSPRADLGDARIVMSRESGALYVRVGDTWHPVLNLASARLIAATDANPRPVRESELRRTKRGPLLGIPGAPQFVAPPLSGAESIWTICDSDIGGVTTVIVATAANSSVRPLAADQTVLVSPGHDSPAYLLYRGQRAMVDLSDPAVQRALKLEGRVPRVVSPSLLNAVPEAPSIASPRIGSVGGPAPAGPPGFAVGSVLRITRAEGDEYYAVLRGGVQRIGQVAADLLRFSNSHGTATVIAVAPDVIGTTPIVNTLPLSTFPDQAPTPVDGATVCATWSSAQSGRPDITFSAGSGVPVPAGQVPVRLAQADGRGPALDAVYLPPGRSAYVADSTRAGTRYLVTDSGVRFAVHDDDAAHDLGLPPAAVPAPWPVLATLPSGPELSRQRASVARDAILP